ncbi:hypothetical protein PoB_004232300 [Plakobranchus ocellatus]|uniref:Uncharacterized protein n=1 Tax=Plakobranchus ocellatus TaxID=259542 RepID=A0AAV4B887_9GAST|nr:hypothetical protein PoB_004232300 [Plakobranchus ocellatus]
MLDTKGIFSPFCGSVAIKDDLQCAEGTDINHTWFLYIASPQQGDLRLLDPTSDQGAGRGARTRDRRFPANLRADSLTTVPPTPRITLGQGS